MFFVFLWFDLLRVDLVAGFMFLSGVMFVGLGLGSVGPGSLDGFDLNILGFG